MLHPDWIKGVVTLDYQSNTTLVFYIHKPTRAVYIGQESLARLCGHETNQTVLTFLKKTKCAKVYQARVPVIGRTKREYLAIALPAALAYLNHRVFKRDSGATKVKELLTKKPLVDRVREKYPDLVDKVS